MSVVQGWWWSRRAGGGGSGGGPGGVVLAQRVEEWTEKGSWFPVADKS